MFSLLPRGSYVDEHISKDYGKEVLLANWQERRQGCEEKTDGIVPGLQRVNACVPHLSEVKDNYYVPFTEEETDDGTRQFLEGRNEALHTFMRNREVQVRFPFAPDMVENCTTTYKIMFEILPKERRREAAENPVCSVPGRPENLDLMLSYGNRTKTGSRCRQRGELRLEKQQRLQTTYAADYDCSGLQR